MPFPTMLLFGDWITSSPRFMESILLDCISAQCATCVDVCPESVLQNLCKVGFGWTFVVATMKPATRPSLVTTPRLSSSRKILRQISIQSALRVGLSFISQSWLLLRQLLMAQRTSVITLQCIFLERYRNFLKIYRNFLKKLDSPGR